MTDAEKIQFTHEWYAVRWERLRKLIHDDALHIEDEACAIMANGTATVGEPPTFAQIIAVLRAELKRETQMYETVVNLHGGIRTAAEEMLAAIEDEYAQGVKNGYWPTVAAKLDRWRAALGLPPLERFHDRGKCGVKYHHRDCDCNGEGGSR